MVKSPFGFDAGLVSRGSGINLAFFLRQNSLFYVSAHTLHSLGQVTVTVKRILVQGLGSRV